MFDNTLIFLESECLHIMRSKISPNDLSVVVAGPICGGVDSPYEQRWTLRVCESIRKYFPGAEIVLSTWKGSDVSGIDYDVLVENDDPGEIIRLDENNVPIATNLNRMIFAVVSGLKKASRKYAIRTRTELIFTSNACLSYWGVYRNFTPEKISKERIVTGVAHRINAHVRSSSIAIPNDFFALGLREDVLMLWDAPLIDMSLPIEKRLQRIPFSKSGYARGEMHPYLSFLKKSPYYRKLFKCEQLEDAISVLGECSYYQGGNCHLKIKGFSELSKIISEKMIADNLVPISFDLLGINSLKYNKIGGYYPVHNAMRYYTFNEWKILYNRYCDGKLNVVLPAKHFSSFIAARFILIVILPMLKIIRRVTLNNMKWLHSLLKRIMIALKLDRTPAFQYLLYLLHK